MQTRGKPFLSNEAYHFSISHCGDFAAAIVSRHNRVGVDVELVKPMIQKIRHKFLGIDEMQLLPGETILSRASGSAIDNGPGETPSSYFFNVVLERERVDV